MRFPTSCLAALLAAWPLVVSAQPKLAVESFKLPNGLRVVLHEDHRIPQVAVITWFQVGSRDERPGKTGFAHLFEHLMFKGSAHVPDGVIDDLTEEAGGGTNAFTSTDMTVYNSVTASNFLEQLLYLEADRLAGLTDTLDLAKLDNQREVVRNERRQTTENVPYGIAELLIPENLWPKGHGYHWSTIGYHEDLVAASIPDVKEFFATYYVPSNAVMVIVGDFDSKQAKKLVEKYFAWIPSPPSVKRPVHATPPPITKEIVVSAEDDVQVPQLHLVWRAPALRTPEEPALELLGSILGDSKTSRLYQRLVFRDRIAQEVDAGYYDQEVAGEFHIVATAKPGVTSDKLKAVIGEELARFAKEGPTADELAHAKNRVEARMLRRIEPYVGRGVRIAEWVVRTGNPDGLAADLARFRNVTAADVQRAAVRYLAPNARVALTIVPRAAGGAK
jgi:zinc protease